jgi:hypothetical protein
MSVIDKKNDKYEFLNKGTSLMEIMEKNVFNYLVINIRIAVVTVKFNHRDNYLN